MLLLEDIFKQLIVETISRDKILRAINERAVVTIYYKGDDDKKVLRGYRRCEIWCYGRNHFGNDVVRVWILPKSVSKTYPPGKTNPVDVLTWKPGWRMLRISFIQSIRFTGAKFNQQRPKFNAQDKDMAQIYSCVKI